MLKLLDMIETGFRNAKHRSQWRNTLTTYTTPIWNKRLAEIETDDVLACLRPIWTAKAETASRVRGRIERVLDAAAARGLRSRDNPARWRGHFANLLPKRPEHVHHAAMPFDDLPAYVARLRESDGISARALEFTILTAARSGEVLGAGWSEINLVAKVWTVPASRMKAAREHRVPLSERAVEILSALAAVKIGDYVFPGAKRGSPLSVMALTMVMRRMGMEAFTVHGFRSAFRDWAGERTNFPREVASGARACRWRMDPGRSPQRVLKAHSSNEVAHLLADPRSAPRGAGLPSPVCNSARHAGCICTGPAVPCSFGSIVAVLAFLTP